MQQTTAQALAEQFSVENHKAIQWVEGCPDAFWRRACGGDTRSAGVVAHHMASSFLNMMQLVTLAANGQPLPTLTLEMFHHGNAQDAATFADCTQAQVRDLLRANGDTVVTAISRLSREQLARETYVSLTGATMSTQMLIEAFLIGHTSSHLAEIQAA